MPLPLIVSCFSKIQIGFTVTFLVPAYPGSPGIGPLNGYVCNIANALVIAATVYIGFYLKNPIIALVSVPLFKV